MPKSVVVLGSNGQLGSELQSMASKNITYLSREELDLSNSDQVKNYFQSHRYDLIINCAAYTAVDKAETEFNLAKQINCTLVETLAHIAKDNDSALIHISTDYVFDGKSFTPYQESDLTNPQSVYGKTKLAGEQALIKVNPKNSIIIRTSWVYSEFGNNFVKTMLRLGSERDQLGVIFDQVGTPTYAKDLAKAIMYIGDKIDNNDTEIYHYSNEGACSWYDFAQSIFEISHLSCNVTPIETHEYPVPAKRPPYSILNKSKIKKDFDLTIPYWRDSLKECINILKEKK